MRNRIMNYGALYVLLSLLLVMPVEGSCQQRFRVGVCDWMILKRQKLGEFALAREVGADGVEVDMGPLGKRPMFDNRFRNLADANLFRRTADSLGISVPSIAMSGFFAQDFISHYNYRELVQDCLNTMEVFDARVAFLPLGGCGNSWLMPGVRRDELVSRLHEAGEMARQAGVVIGIRTGQDARATIRLLKEVDSEGIKVYYNMQDAVDEGRDVCKELKRLGRKRICQIHASLTDSVTLDKDPRIDMRAVRKTLDRMKWSGWLVVERSRDVMRVRDVGYNYAVNVGYLHEVFGLRPSKK